MIHNQRLSQDEFDLQGQQIDLPWGKYFDN